MRIRRTVGTLLGLAALAAAAPASAQGQIGRAAAVVPQAQGTPPQGPARVLQVGLDMFQDERVQTGPEGRTQLLFVDGTALTVGPNSDVVLDEYVYDPAAGSGRIALSATRGVFRLVGGKISKGEPVTLRTPTVTIGVRGGVAFATVGETVTAGFVFGDEMTATGGGATQRTTRPGTEIVTPPTGIPNPPQPISSASIAASLNATEGAPGQQSGPAVSNEDVADTQLAELSSGAAPGVVSPGGGFAPPPNPTAFEEAAGRTEASQINQTEQASEGGGDGSLNFGNLVGRYKHSSSVAFGSDDSSPGLNIPFTGGGVAAGRFQAIADGSLLSVPVQSGSFAFSGAANATQSPFGPITGTGFLAPSGDFLFIEGFEDNFPGDRIVTFAGTPTPAAAVPTSGVVAYDLRPDFLLGGSSIPFLPQGMGGSLASGAARALIDWSPGSRAFMAARIAISGQGPSQQLAGSLLTGRVLTSPSGQSFLRGQMGGIYSASTTAAPFLFEGDFSTSDAGDGSDFFGAVGPDFFVLEATLANFDDALPSAPNGIAVEQGGLNVATIRPNSIASKALAAADQTRTSRNLIIETAGITRDSTGGPAVMRRFFTDSSPGTLSLNAANGTAQAFVNIASFDPGGFGSASLAMGQSSPTEFAAFVNDRNFAALGVVSGSLVNGSPVSDNGAVLVSTDQLVLSGVLPPGVTPCVCAYVSSGMLFGAFEPTPSSEHLFVAAPFAAGAPVNAGQFPISAMATYSGAAWANVAQTGTGNLYVAAGSFSATASFVPGNVNLSASITNLDSANLSFSGSAGVPGPILLSGSGSHPGFGALSGSMKLQFAGPGTPPEEVFGHFIAADMTGTTYLQAGAFAGKR